MFPGDFLELGNMSSIVVALARLVQQQRLERLAKGIYYIPKFDNVIGDVRPSMDAIAETIAQRDKARIRPTGAVALHKLGLSSQVPMNHVYYTDGTSRKIKIGNGSITFKKAAPKKLSTRGKISSLVIAAMEELGKDGVTDDIILKIGELLKKEDKQVLIEDAKLAPAWITKILLKFVGDL